MEDEKWQRWCDPWEMITLALDVWFYGWALIVWVLAGLLVRESYFANRGGTDGEKAQR